MIRAVLDTNLIISYLLTQGKTLTRIIQGWENSEFIYLISPEMVIELIEVVERPKLNSQMGIEPERFLNSINNDAEILPGDLKLSGICRDPKDDQFIACAIEGKADYLVSGDKDLLDIGEYQGVQIIRPYDFVKILDNLPFTT